MKFLQKMKLLWWFIKGCHHKDFLIQNEALFTTFLRNASARFYQLSLEQLLEKYKKLISNLSEDSKKTVEKYLRFYIGYPVYQEFVSLKSPVFIPSQSLSDKERLEISRKTGLNPKFILNETWISKNGLAFFNEKVKEYIKNKIFIDCGAYYGDSVLVMKDFSPSKIYSFDASPAVAEGFSQTIRNNQIDKNLVEFVNYGLGERCEELFLNDGEKGCSIHALGKQKIKITTVDCYFKALPTVGFIKADIEGAALKLTKGMADILKRDRPVLALSIYHNPEEFFEVKPFIESLNLDYRFEICPLGDFYIGEIALLAYPAELV